jgi:hypothetical protein
MKQLQQRRKTTERKQTADVRRKRVQKIWKVGINKKENGKVENKFNRTTTSRGGGTFFTLHTYYNFVVSFPITPFFLSSPPCFLFQTFGIHTLEQT